MSLLRSLILTPFLGFLFIYSFAQDRNYNDPWQYKGVLVAGPMEANLSSEEKAALGSESAIIIAGPEYEASGFKRFLLGDHYREAWGAPENTMVFRIQFSGLEPDEPGGGFQTKSLKLKDESGVEYTIRSVNKEPEKTLPKWLRNTFVEKLIQDQISASHPYGFMIVPDLAEAAGIYHTDPRLIYLPVSEVPAEFQNELGGMVAMIEVKPEGDMSAYEQFGRSAEVVDTEEMIDMLYSFASAKVDQELYLKSRLFDMWLGDWDRHDEQWEWGMQQENGDIVFEPIPRDRDQVFYSFDGVLPWVFEKASLVKGPVNFKHKIRNIDNLNWAARDLDMRFLNSLEKEQWIEIAKTLQQSLTDEVIENAVQNLPNQSYLLTGEEIVSKLKARREQLDEVALKYYLMLAKNPVYVTSCEDEHVLIENLGPNTTAMTVYEDQNGKPGRQLFHRVYDANDTRAIHIVNFGTNDKMECRGDKNKIDHFAYNYVKF